MPEVDISEVEPTREEILKLDQLSLTYGSGVVVQSASLSVRSGEIIAVLGPNGAGKTTLLRGIVGLSTICGGTVEYRGRQVRHPNPERAAGMGIAYVPQGRMLFPYSTGMMNLWSGTYPRSDRREVQNDIDSFLSAWPIARRVARQHAVGMSGGEQQIVAIGRGRMARPNLLLVDEPSLGLSPMLFGEVAKLVKGVVEDRDTAPAGVIIVEQNVGLALSIATSICLLVDGKVVYRGPCGELTPAEISDLYLR